MTVRVEKLRSTSKVVKERIREYILANLCEDYTTETGEQLQAVVDGFNDWYGRYERKRNPNMFTAWCEWIMGLPSSLSIDYYYDVMRTILDTWFETDMYTLAASDERRNNKWTDDEVQELFLWLIYRELKTLMQQHDVDRKGLFL